MKSLESTQTAVFRARSAALGLALLVPLSAAAQTASIFHFMVPNGATTASIGFRGAALGYEDKVPAAKILDLQYALLHALGDWSGHPQDKDRELSLLKSAGITVTPLAPEQRVILEDKLQAIRTKRNFGVPNGANNRRPMSLQQMAESHRALIAENAGAIKYGAPGTGGGAASAAQRTTTAANTADARDKYGPLFDGSAGPRPNLGLPSPLSSNARREMAHNAPGAGTDAAVPSPEKGHGGGPGLFGMLGGLLGGLLKGLLRTAVRVAGAVMQGALGVVKAVFS
jgi:hypothetical protein